MVEHFEESGRHDLRQPFPTLPSGNRVACAVHLPADDVVAVVEGEDEASVCDAVTTAGWRVDRITAATRAQVSS